jgi:GTP cyclohydrolase II
MNMPHTPELEKQTEIVNSGKAELIQEFYDWLHQEKGWVLARWVPTEERFPGDGIYGEQPVPVYVQPEQLMADFFGIDRDKIETERRAILAAIQEANSG